MLRNKIFCWWQARPTKNSLVVQNAFWLFVAIIFFGVSNAQDSVYSVEIRQDQELGFYLTSSDHMTLYVSEADEAYSSQCGGKCQQRWIPYTLGNSESLSIPPEFAGNLELMNADDGLQQLAYEGKPLYQWHKDRNPGDMKGHGKGKKGDRRNVANIRPTVRVQMDGEKSWLIGPDGMTLYNMVVEKNALADCVAGCAMNWPPLVVGTHEAVAAPELGGTLDVIKRLPPDNRMQVTYKGKPLYFWSRDKSPGDTSGNGIGEIWVIALP